MVNIDLPLKHHKISCIFFLGHNRKLISYACKLCLLALSLFFQIDHEELGWHHLSGL
jgi:hypothetical protein